MNFLYSTVLLLSLANFGLATDCSTCASDGTTCNHMYTVYADAAKNMSSIAVPLMTCTRYMYNYTKTNNTFTGFNNCTLENVETSEDYNVLKYDMNCPAYTIGGHLDVFGYLLYPYVYGSGPYLIDCGAATVHVYNVLEQVNGTNGTYFQITNFDLYVDLIGNCTVTLSGLYGGNETRTTTGAAFVTKNHKEVMRFEDPAFMWTPAMEIMKVPINEELAKYTTDEMLCSSS